jgi:DUF1680 family protein
MKQLNRRDFLKAATASTGALAYAGVFGGPAAAGVEPGTIPLADATPLDHPIEAKRSWDVTLTDGFWKPRVAKNAEVTIPVEVRKLMATERGLAGNVLEAAMLSLKTHPDPVLQAQVDAAVKALAARRETGNEGFEVAAAYFFTTGKRDLIEPAIAAAEALDSDFRRNDPPFAGGERDAINCVQLYRVTHNPMHLDLAKHYLDIRGRADSVNRSRHNQSYKPVLEQSEAVGHAVNCVSLMVSLADVGILTGNADYFDAAHRMWLDAVTRKMYITGGVGTTGNEGFGEPYSLPNISAYSETCAVLMFITLNHRMFLATGDSRYIDVMERGMYNNAIAGVSSSGDRFFYVNRLASAGDGRDLRWERASLECCPPNLVRFMASMPGYIYAQDQEGAVYINLYVSSDVSFRVGTETIGLSIRCEMPWGGRSRIAVSAAGGVHAALKLRVPGWARNQPVPGTLYSYMNASDRQATVTVNGRQVGEALDAKGYITLERRWEAGDIVEVDLPLQIRSVVADQKVHENRGRMAIERGPIVYCAEWPDTGDGRVLERLFEPGGEMTAASGSGLFASATVIHARARYVSRPTDPAHPITLIPYYLWANRGAGEMSVWLSKEEYVPGDVGPAGGLIFFVNPNDESDGWRYLEAAPVDQSAGARWGCFRRVIAGARGTAVGTGRQNTQDILAACTESGTAAEQCASYRLNGIGGWFLPSRAELALMYRNLKAAGIGDFRDGGAADNFSYWTSSQQTADMAEHIDFADNGRQHYDDKDFPRRVRAIRTF